MKLTAYLDTTMVVRLDALTLMEDDVPTLVTDAVVTCTIRDRAGTALGAPSYTLDPVADFPGRYETMLDADIWDGLRVGSQGVTAEVVANAADARLTFRAPVIIRQLETQAT